MAFIGRRSDEALQTTVKVAAHWASDSASDWASHWAAHSTVFNRPKVVVYTLVYTY